MSLANPRVGMTGARIGNPRTGITPSRIAPPPPTPQERSYAVSRGRERNSWGDYFPFNLLLPDTTGKPQGPVPPNTRVIPYQTEASRQSQSGQSYIDNYNRRWQRSTTNAFNDGMRAAADADRWVAEADANFNRSMTGINAAQAFGDYQRTMGGLDVNDRYSAGVADLGRADARRIGDTLVNDARYRNDIEDINARMYQADIADTEVDRAANERQFGLINATRGDLANNLARERARFTDVEAAITQNEVSTKRRNKQDNYKLFSEMAASGNITQIARMTGKELEDSLVDNLANFQRERNQLGRDRAQAEQDYQTRLRDLQEQEAQAVDAREKLRLRRQMQDLDDQKRRRDHLNSLVEIENQKKQNFLNLMNVELTRRRQIDETRISREAAEAKRLNDFFTAVASQRQIDQQRMAAAAAQQAAKAIYPASRPSTLLPPTYRTTRGRGGR